MVRDRSSEMEMTGYRGAEKGIGDGKRRSRVGSGVEMTRPREVC